MVELGIVDIREIIRIVKDKYQFDLSNYALTSLKYSLEYLINRNNFNSPESLLRRLMDEPDYLDAFIYEISTPSTEMFRDPSLWRWLRDHIFANPEIKFDNYKIWLPYCVSGGELYSLCIALKEHKLLDKVHIIASTLSNEAIKHIKIGKYPLKKLETSIENYNRTNAPSEFKEYYNIEQHVAIRDTSLINNVEFIKDDLDFSKAPKNVKLILFRNVLIYFNPKMQSTLLSMFHEKLSATGHLIIGVQERIKETGSENFLFESIDPVENVYKKKI